MYKHNGVTLHKLLQEEISKLTTDKVDFAKCSHSVLNQAMFNQLTLILFQFVNTQYFCVVFVVCVYFLVKMEVIEDGNIMDRIPILLQRDLEYYQVRNNSLNYIIAQYI